MKIYRLSADVNRYQNLSFVNENDWEILHMFNGLPISQSWTPLRVYVPPEYKSKPTTDIPGFSSHVPIFSAKALDSLKSLLEKCGETLRLDCPDGEYYAFNVTNLIEVDEQKATIKRFKDGTIMDITRYVFFPDQLADVCIFKVSQMPLGLVFINEQVISRIQESKLIGFDCLLIWHD